jgi:hypothetical protein
LNQTEAESEPIRGEIRQLEANITSLHDQLRKAAVEADMIAVGLTFFWMQDAQGYMDWFNHNRMQPLISSLNWTWDTVGVYFFAFHSEPHLVDYNVSTPMPELCGPLSPSANSKHEGRDMPVVVLGQPSPDAVPEMGEPLACACLKTNQQEGYAVLLSLWTVVSARNSAAISHEFLHVFGYLTEEEVRRVYDGSAEGQIQAGERSRIQAAASRFDTLNSLEDN